MIIQNEDRRLLLNVWTRIAVNFTVRIEYKDGGGNNQYPIDIPVALADITKRSYPIRLIKGTVLSISIYSNTANVLRGHTFIQCFLVDSNSLTPLNLLFSDYLTTAKPIGFPFTGIKDNGEDINNGLVVADHNTLNAVNVFNFTFTTNIISRIDELDYFLHYNVNNVKVYSRLEYFGDVGTANQNKPLMNFNLVPPVVGTTARYYLQKRVATITYADPASATNAITVSQLYEVPVFKTNATNATILSLFVTGAGANFTITDTLDVVTHELLNCI